MAGGWLIATFPTITLSATGVADPPYAQEGSLASSFPAITLSATVLQGEVGTADIHFVDTVYPNELIITLEGEGRFGDVGILEADFPAIELSGEGRGLENGVLSEDFPAILISATGIDGEVGTLQATLPTITISATGQATFSNIGIGQMTFPMIVLEASGQELSTGMTIATVIVMNTSTFGVSEYTNFPFNSYCKIGDDYYGADSTGIHKLTGDTDNDTAIAMEIKKEKIDGGDTHEKRVRDIYLNVEADGDLSLEIIADKSQAYLLSNGRPGLHAHKLTPGKGLRGQFLGFDIKNMAGSDLKISQIEMVIDVLSRRGRDEQ